MRTLSLLAIVAGAAAAGCGSDTTGPIPNPPTSLTLTVAPSLATIGNGQRISLQARAVYPDGSSTSPSGVEWRSLDDRIATVEPGGIVQGEQEGEALILSVWGDMRGSARVIVQARPAGKQPEPCVEALLARVGPSEPKENDNCR